jgi:agmatinase
MADEMLDTGKPSRQWHRRPSWDSSLRSTYGEHRKTDIRKKDKDSGTTYRPGARFGPQGIRRIYALYTPYNYELGVDLREQMTLCDAGDVFTIPGNIEKSFDQITRGVGHVFSSGALPLLLGGDHSIGFPCVRGIAQCTSKTIGIVHFDRHIDIQEKDLDERMAGAAPWS